MPSIFGNLPGGRYVIGSEGKMEGALYAMDGSGPDGLCFSGDGDC